MKTYNITNEIYFEMAERAAKYDSCYWDCIELEDGCAVTFALENGKPCDVEAYDEEDNRMTTDFDLARFNLLAA